MSVWRKVLLHACVRRRDTSRTRQTPQTDERRGERAGNTHTHTHTHTHYFMVAKKTPYFSVINMIIGTKLDVLAAPSYNGAALVWKRGRGAAAAHLHLKRQAQKQHVSSSTQNRHFQNDILNYLWGILS